MREVLEFAAREGLVLMADEGYQDNVYNQPGTTRLAHVSNHFNSFRRALAELATALRAPETISETGGAATAKDASREASENNVDHASVAAAARAAADLCDLAAATRTFFRAVPVKPFESPFVQVGAYGGDAGTVRRASYGPLAPWAFLVAWHAEFEERADKVLDLDTRGATRLPRPDGPLCRACLTGSNDRATDRLLSTWRSCTHVFQDEVRRTQLAARDR